MNKADGEIITYHPAESLPLEVTVSGSLLISSINLKVIDHNRQSQKSLMKYLHMNNIRYQKTY